MALDSARRRRILSSGLTLVPPALLRTGGTMVDVGCFRGDWTEAALDLLGPRPVVAVEPDPAGAAELRQRFSSRPNVVVRECALAAEAGNHRLRLMSSGDFNSLLDPVGELDDFYGEIAPTGEAVVAVETLDRLLAEVDRVSVLKIDVQGMETAVLAGGEETLRRTDAVIMEVLFVHHYEGDRLWHELVPDLEGRGFYFHRFGTIWNSPQTGRALWADAVFVRSA